MKRQTIKTLLALLVMLMSSVGAWAQSTGSKKESPNIGQIGWENCTYEWWGASRPDLNPNGMTAVYIEAVDNITDVMGWHNCDVGDANSHMAKVVGNVNLRNVYGGYSTNGDANNNVVIINSGTFSGNVVGGYAHKGATASGNKVFFNEGHMGGEYKVVSGGQGKIVTGNEVIINGGTFGNEIAGGIGMDSGSEVSGNTVTINGGTMRKIFGGNIGDTSYKNITTNNNTVNILAAISATQLTGGIGEISKGNTLNLGATGITVGDNGVTHFQTIGVIEDAVFAEGATVLSAKKFLNADGTNFSGTLDLSRAVGLSSGAPGTMTLLASETANNFSNLNLAYNAATQTTPVPITTEGLIYFFREAVNGDWNTFYSSRNKVALTDDYKRVNFTAISPHLSYTDKTNAEAGELTLYAQPAVSDTDAGYEVDTDADNNVTLSLVDGFKKLTIAGSTWNTVNNNSTLGMNMPKTGINTLTLNGVADNTFRVYDDGGKSGNYSNGCNGTLVITVPEGYLINVKSNSIALSQTSDDYLNIYDNDAASGKMLGAVRGDSYDGSAINYTSKSNYLTLQFNSSAAAATAAGLDLTVTIKEKTLLTNNLSNATVDFWVSASEPTSTTVFADEDKTNLAEPGEYVVMHIVPSDGYWTDPLLLFSMETGALKAPSLRAPGLDLGRIPTLLKADEGYYNGAGWYYYQIPAAHTTDSYKTSTVDGFVVPTFDLRNATASVDGKTLTVASGDWNTTVSIDKNSFTYNGAAQGPLLSGTTMQIKKGTDDACTLPLSGNVTLSSTATNAGNHNATLSAATNGCFASTTAIPFTIGKKDLTVTANNHSIVFGSAAANNGVSYNGFENNETAAVLGGTLAYAYNTANDNTGTPYTAGTSDVGTYYIIPSGLTSNNYNIAYATGTMTVNAKRVNDSSVADEQDSKITILTTDIPTAGYVYDGTAKTPTVQVKDGDNVISPDEYTVSYSNNINAGTTATVTITNKAGGNYTVSGTTTFSIAQKTLTITANDQEKATGSDDPTLTYTQDGLVAGDAITGALTRVAGEAVGSYAISQGTLSAGNNYTINFTGATLTIYRDLKMAEMFSGTNEWASMIALEDLAVPAGMAAYIVTGVSGNTVITKEISYIPAGVPIILQKKDNNASGKATAVTGTDDVSENLLKGSATEASTIQPYKDYVLYNGRFELAGVSSVPAGKVYLPATALSGTAAPGFLMIGDETTSLSPVPSPSRDGGSQAWYTIDGRKLDKKPMQKGVYVNGGIKVVVK